MSKKRGGVLELAVLGLLQESPLHGYELRKRLNTLLGSLRALSYGSLYPALRDMQTGRSHRRGPPGRGRPRQCRAGAHADAAARSSTS